MKRINLLALHETADILYASHSGSLRFQGYIGNKIKLLSWWRFNNTMYRLYR